MTPRESMLKDSIHPSLIATHTADKCPQINTSSLILGLLVRDVPGSLPCKPNELTKRKKGTHTYGESGSAKAVTASSEWSLSEGNNDC